MKLRTLVPVTYRNKLTGSKSGIVTMELGSIVYEDSTFSDISVNYTYKDNLGVVIWSDAFNFKGATTINGMFALIQPSLPTFENEVQYTQAKFFEGAKYQMAQTFGIAVSNIEIVNE